MENELFDFSTLMTEEEKQAQKDYQKACEECDARWQKAIQETAKKEGWC